MSHYNTIVDDQRKQLLQMETELKQLREQNAALVTELQLVKPKADAYDRTCQTLGIRSNIVGHVELIEQRAKMSIEAIKLGVDAKMDILTQSLRMAKLVLDAVWLDNHSIYLDCMEQVGAAREHLEKIL